MTTFHQLPELASFQDEPRQMPSGVVGKDAFLRLGFERRGERTVLTHLNRRAPLLMQQALYWDTDKIFSQVSAVVNLEEQWAAGASRRPNDAGLIFKVLSQESEPVRAKVRDF